MNVFKAELSYFLRSPIIWIIAAISAFLSAWSFLLAIELFTGMQVKFAGMADAPTLVQGIIVPTISVQAKSLMFIVPIIAGLSFSRLSTNNGWSLVHAYGLSELHLIKQKYFAILLVSMLFILPTFTGVLVLAYLAKISLLPVVVCLLGLFFLLMWMLSFCMFLSSLVSNSGFAILLCFVVLLLLWFFSLSALDSQDNVWGKNWIQAVSPNYHFQRFLSPYLTYSSVFYFIAGTFISIWAIKLRIIYKRYLLS